VHCVAEDGDILPADQCDSSLMPHDSEKCFAPKCPEPAWTFGAWSKVQHCHLMGKLVFGTIAVRRPLSVCHGCIVAKRCEIGPKLLLITIAYWLSSDIKIIDLG